MERLHIIFSIPKTIVIGTQIIWYALSCIAADREVLRKYYPELMRTLKYRDVYPYVVQRGLVTHSQMMELASSVESEKTEKLLAMLIGSSSGVLSKFIWCLKQSGNGTAHKLIGQKLEKARAEMKVQPGI